LVASDEIIVFHKDNKTVTLGDSIQRQQLFLLGFGAINTVTLLLRITRAPGLMIKYLPLNRQLFLPTYERFRKGPPVARAAAAPTPRRTLKVNEARGIVAVAKTDASQNFTCPTTQRHRSRAEWAP
jgi:hypothetical protein